MFMARAVVVGKCNADKDDSESWKQNWHYMRRSDRPVQTSEAMKLLDRAKIPKSCGIEEYKMIQSVLAPKYLIKVHSQYPKDGLIFPLQFSKKPETKVIHIYFNGEDHYDAIRKVTGFLGGYYYCEYCDVGYTNRGDHRRADGCDGCYSDIPCIVFLDKKRVVWTVKEHFVVETVLKSIRQSNLSSINLFVNMCIIVVNVILGLWAIRKIMYAQDRENVGIVKRLLDPIINAIFKVMNVNLR